MTPEIPAQTPATPPWTATILTLYPAMFPGPLGVSLSGDALARGTWALEARDIREHGLGRHRAVDDTPAGVAPAWFCAATCSAPPSTRRHRATMRGPAC